MLLGSTVCYVLILFGTDPHALLFDHCSWEWKSVTTNRPASILTSLNTNTNITNTQVVPVIGPQLRNNDDNVYEMEEFPPLNASNRTSQTVDDAEIEGKYTQETTMVTVALTTQQNDF